MRRRMPCTILPAAVLVVLLGCQQQPMFSLASMRGGSPPTPEQLAKLNLELYWELPVALRGSERIQRLYQIDESIYCLTTEGRLIAIDAVVGRTRWTAVVADRGLTVFAPCHADNVIPPKVAGTIIVPGRDLDRAKTVNAVIINTVNYALMFDRATGEELCRIDFPFAANSPGSSDGAYFYVASVDGRYHCLRLNDGLTRWTLSTQDMIKVRPLYYARTVYVASMDGTFAAVNPEANANRRVWMQTTDGPLTGTFHVDARACFVPSQDHKLYAYHPATGEDLWKFFAKAPLVDPVQVGKQTVFQYAEKDRLYALDVATGRKRWELPQGRLALLVDGGNAYVLTPERMLLTVNEMTGEVTGKVDFRGFPQVVPNVVKPVIFACTAGGKLVCIRPIGSGALTAEMLADVEPTERSATMPALPTSAPTTEAAPESSTPAPTE